MTIQKIKAGRVNGIDADSFIGDRGQLFYNEGVGDLRVGDGETPGGIPLSFGGGGGGSYTLPTATTSIKGGVKIDGTTITINNQIISVGTVPYSSLSGTPTIPTNTNQLTNGAGYITSAALSGYATESYVTGRGYITSSALSDYALTSSIPTNNNQLTNGAGYITSSALTGYATESYVTTRGYITSSALSGYALTSAIPTDISQLTDNTGLLGQGGGGGTTYITNNVQNPYSFNIAGDDSTLREITNANTVQFKGATGISVSTNADGVITITGPDLSLYATQTYVTGQGYITSAALTGYASEIYVNQAVSNLVDGAPAMLDTLKELADSINNDGNIVVSLTAEISKKANISDLVLTIAGDDSSERTINLGEGIKLQGTGSVTITTDSEGAVTINGAAPDLSSYATQTYVTSQNYITSAALTGLATETFVTTRGYLTSVSWNQLTDKPDLAGTYSWNIAADDSTQIEVASGNLVKIVGSRGVTTTSNVDGQITITGPDLSSYATQTYVNAALSSAGVTVSPTAPTGLLNGALWYNSTDLELYVLYDSQWVATSASFSGNYNDLTNKPTNVSQFTNDAGFTTRDEVYAMILELMP